MTRRYYEYTEEELALMKEIQEILIAKIYSPQLPAAFYDSSVGSWNVIFRHKNTSHKWTARFIEGLLKQAKKWQPSG